MSAAHGNGAFSLEEAGTDKQEAVEAGRTVDEDMYDDMAGDIYGLDGDQIESAIQTQSITLAPSEWSPSMRSNRRAQRTSNPLIKPKPFKKPN